MFPVHASHAFISIDSIAGALCLLVTRFLHGDYEAAFRTAAWCITDKAMTAEEHQVLYVLGLDG